MASENVAECTVQNRGWDVEAGEASMARKGLSDRKAGAR